MQKMILQQTFQQIIMNHRESAWLFLGLTLSSLFMISGAIWVSVATKWNEMTNLLVFSIMSIPAFASLTALTYNAYNAHRENIDLYSRYTARWDDEEDAVDEEQSL